MKKALLVVLSLVFAVPVLVITAALLFSVLFAPKDPILASLPDYLTKEFYTCGGFQDSTDYAKYTYEVSESVFIHSPYFLRVSSVGTERFLTYLDNFENWVDTCEDFPAESYDFDRSVISENDYFYILNRYEEPEMEFYSYNLYFFDLESQTLYYFHNNI